MTSDLKAIVTEFNTYINNQDIESLSNMMHDDYTFIDMAGNVEKGKEQGIRSWNAFFEEFPDYKNIFEKMSEEQNLVRIIGYSTCSQEIMDGPAIWTAKILGGKVLEWRVYEDTLRNRKKVGL